MVDAGGSEQFWPHGVSWARETAKMLIGPKHMLAKTVLDRHYRDPAALADALASVLAEQVALLEAEVIQVDEANLPGHPEEWPWAARAIRLVSGWYRNP